MKRLNVKTENYTNFVYSPFINRSGSEIERPKNSPFEVGDVVVIKEYINAKMGKEESIGVVLGCIDVESEDLRTDMSGMVSFDRLRLATKEDFEADEEDIERGLRYVTRLKKEALED